MRQNSLAKKVNSALFSVEMRAPSTLQPFSAKRTASNTAKAEYYFQEALAIARRQGAKSWELRAALSLSELWCMQERCQDAYNLLRPIYGWFSEGFETKDLKRARHLLKKLEGSRPSRK